MNLHDPIHVLLLAAFIVGFIAGAIFAGVLFEVGTRRWRKRNRPFVGMDFGNDDSSCTVIGHYTPDGYVHIDHVEIGWPQSRRRWKPCARSSATVARKSSTAPSPAS